MPGGLVAENNYGNVGPRPTDTSTTRTADPTPGLVKVAVDHQRGGCRIAWSNTTARSPTVVSKLSRGSGMIYGYMHPSASEPPMTAPVPEALAPDAWFFTAFSARTGKQAWSRYTGSGLGYNNNYAPLSLGPDGAAYVGTLGGLLRIADTR